MTRTKISIFFILFLIVVRAESFAQSLKDELESKKRSKEIEKMLQEDKEKLAKSDIAKTRAALAKNGFQIKCEGKISEPSASFESAVGLITEKERIDSLFKILVISGNDLYFEKRDIGSSEKSLVKRFGSVDMDTKFITFKHHENMENVSSGYARVADYPEWQFEFTAGDLYIKKRDGYPQRIFLLNRCKKIAWTD
jgi:hypothetical protein